MGGCSLASEYRACHGTREFIRVGRLLAGPGWRVCAQLLVSWLHVPVRGPRRGASLPLAHWLRPCCVSGRVFRVPWLATFRGCLFLAL